VCPNDAAFGVSVAAALTCFSSAFGTVAYIAVLVVDVAAVEKKFKLLLLY